MALKPLPEDFKEFINFLNANKVKYLLPKSDDSILSVTRCLAQASIYVS